MSDIVAGTYFKYQYKNPFNGEISISVLEVIKVNIPWLTMKTSGDKTVRRKIRTSSSGVNYVKYDAFCNGGNNKFEQTQLDASDVAKSSSKLVRANSFSYYTIVYIN